MSSLPEWLPAVPLVLSGAVYALGVHRLRSRGDRWPPLRTGCGLLGLGCLAVALLPPLAPRDEDFRVHVAQHLLLSSVAPLLLARSGLVILALRTLPRSPRARLLSLLHSRAAGWFTSPAVVVLLGTGSLYALYVTPLFGLVEDSTLLHVVVHVHMLAVGCLLSWFVVGIDPMPRRPGIRSRAIVLLVVAAGHDVLAKLLVARNLPDGVPAGQVDAGARLMFYGGDVVEVALLVVLLAGWYARPVRQRVTNGIGST